MYSLDMSLFYTLHNLAGHAAWLDWLIVVVGEYLVYAVLLFVALCMFREWHQRRYKRLWGYVAAVLAAFVARYGVTEIIRHFYHHERPYIAFNIPHLLTDTLYSFPSGHTIFMFALATGIYRINKRLAWCLYGLGLLIGVARVAGGIHYPSDILGGAVLGIAVGYAVVALWKWFSRIVALPTI
jgi:undecaprenyl-diphosphatase